MAGARRQSRIAIFQALYEIDSTRHNAEDVVSRLLVEKKLSEDNSTFVRQNVLGVIQNKQKLDENIQRFAPAWPVDQLPMVDRNILRFAIFELLMDNKVPTSIAINEAVELAKKFGSDSSARFVNGVLSSVNTLATG
ncbi:MAG: transcription antitermination factor NusB [Dehalococcoidia bacterium]|nr:MAG: transcription antitermination factor NusB [Dehalococcoidia bacterium]